MEFHIINFQILNLYKTNIFTKNIPLFQVFGKMKKLKSTHGIKEKVATV